MRTLVVASRVRILHFADDKVVVPGVGGAFAHVTRCEPDSDVRGHRPVPSVNGSRPTAGGGFGGDCLQLQGSSCHARS